MRILYIHSLMFHHRTWQRVVDQLKADGIDLRQAGQSAAAELIDASQGDIDLLVADLAVGLPGYDQLLSAGRFVTHRIGLSHEMPAEFTTFSMDTAAEFKRYPSAVSRARRNTTCSIADAMRSAREGWPRPQRWSGVNPPSATGATVLFFRMPPSRTWPTRSSAAPAPNCSIPSGSPTCAPTDTKVLSPQPWRSKATWRRSWGRWTVNSRAAGWRC